MARLSKNERIRQHKLVYGRTFVVDSEHDDQPFQIVVKVTKLVRKGNNDRMYIKCNGTYPRKVSWMEYAYEPFQFFGYVVWNGVNATFVRKGAIPYFMERGGYDFQHVRERVKKIMEGCETILLEITILEESYEQNAKTSAGQSPQTETEAERRT